MSNPGLAASWLPQECAVTLAGGVVLSLSSVHSPEVLRARAEDVSSLQLLRFISLHAAAGSHHGCRHTGLQLIPGSTEKPIQKDVDHGGRVRGQPPQTRAEHSEILHLGGLCAASPAG